MQTSLSARTRTRTAAAALIAAALAVPIAVGPGSTVAWAKHFVGSKSIRDNSVRSVDVRDGTLQGRDIKDGSLSARDFDEVMSAPTGLLGPAGPVGPEGPAGPVGLAGPQGPAGPEGPQGAKGEDGAPGANGVDGAPGANGVDGAPGANGVDGVDGAPGVNGDGGPRGPVGPQGPQGAQGPEGPAGKDGGRPDEVLSWHVSHEEGAKSGSNVRLDSRSVVAANTQVELLGLTVKGEFRVCTESAQLLVSANSSDGRQTARMGELSYSPRDDAWTVLLEGGGGFVMSEAPLRVSGSCVRSDGEPVSMPAFEVDATLALTKRDVTPTGSFD